MHLNFTRSVSAVFFFFSALSTATALAAPAAINQVRFISEGNSDVKALIHLLPADKKQGRRDVSFRRVGGEQTVEIAELLVKQADVEVEYIAFNNLPGGARYDTATLTSTHKLKGDKLGEKPLQTKVKHEREWIDGEEQGSIECRGKVAVTSLGKTLIVRLSGFSSLTSCQGDQIDKLDPLRIGARDVAAGKNRYSPEDDVRFGREFTEEFLRKNADRILPASHPATRYFQGLMERIAAVSDSPGIRPQVYVVNARVLNAFALPGGFVFVFRDLIDSARSEAEVVGVLGHEWAHVAARHGTKNVTRGLNLMRNLLIAKLVSLGVLIAGDVSDNKFLEVAGLVAFQLSEPTAVLYYLNKSREAEAEADTLGSQYAWALNYEPWGLSDMFQVFLARTRPESRMEEMLSDHPALERRVRSVLNLSALFYPVRSTPAQPYLHTTRDFTEMRRDLSALPYPPNADSVNLGNAFAAQLTGKVSGILEQQALADKKVIVSAALAGKVLGDLFGRGKKGEKGDSSQP